MDCEVELAEVGFAEQGGDQRINKVPDQALDHTGERDANDDAHGQVNHVAAQMNWRNSATRLRMTFLSPEGTNG
jgi:hypothetical protein